MGKSKKNKGGRGGGGGGGEDQFDGGTDVDSVSSVSTALSDLQLAQATEQVSSQDYVFDKYIDDLYEKRGSTREAALGCLVDAFESFVLLDLVENKYATLVSQFINSIKKGSIKEVCLACHATAVVTFVGATDLSETQLSMKAIWDVIHPKSGSNVGIVRKPKPPLLAAAVSAWALLLTTIVSSKRNADSWKESITFLSALLEAEDRAVRMAAGEALALCFELKLLDVFSNEEVEVDTAEASGSKNQLFLNMQALKAKISGLVYNLSMEAGGRGADKKNLNDQRDLFQRISDFIKTGECLEESLRIAGKHGILRVTSWRESIQLNYLRRFLGRGFLKHAQDNGLLHDIFDIKMDRTENMSTTEKKIYRSGEEKERALKLNKERRLAQWKSLVSMLAPDDGERGDDGDSEEWWKSCRWQLG
uniref:Interferon-related developmental regulator N-terminal domain-containing protein n=1 Tax=Oryza punctata TaxID=4537 RepID=A0A0E0KFH9_ORYPU